jgi:hypothetical protein
MRLIRTFAPVLLALFLFPQIIPTEAVPTKQSLDQLFGDAALQSKTVKESATAFIYGELVSVADGKAVITVGAANIREANSVTTRVLRVGYRGESFDFVKNVLSFDTQTPWVEIRYREGSSDAPTDTKWGTVEVSSFLRIRTSPWGDITGRLYNGERVQVDLSESKKYWYKIFRGGTSGYSHKNYIVLDGKQSPSPSKPREESKPTPPDQPTPKPSGPLKDRVDTSDGVYIKGVPSFKQNPQGSDPFSPGGQSWRPSGFCGPTSLQMVLAYYGIEKPRNDLALTACSTNGKILDNNVRSTTFKGQLYAKGRGASWEAFTRQGKRFGFKNSHVSGDGSIASIKKRIAKGRPQIVSVRGTLNFKNGRSYHTGGHIIVIRGVRANGDMVINDPVRGGDMVMKQRDFLRVTRGVTIDIKA